MKRKVKQYAENKEFSESLGQDGSTWDYPYKKNWRFLEENYGEDIE